MIKGCSKKVIVVKNTGSSIFEEAYFIVNPKENTRKYSDFLAEANRIIAARTGEARTVHGKSGILRGTLLLISGFVVGACSACTVAFCLL